MNDLKQFKIDLLEQHCSIPKITWFLFLISQTLVKKSLKVNIF